MSDWQVGDLALCICTRDLKEPTTQGKGIAGRRLRMGAIYTVAGLNPHRLWGLSLVLAEEGAGTAGAKRFIKVTPPVADDLDRETLTLERNA